MFAFPAWGQETTSIPATVPEETTAASSEESDACQNFRDFKEVLTVEPTSENTRTPFTITGNAFLVAYDVAFDDPEASNHADIDIEDRFGLVDSVNLSENEANDFIVTEGAGSYDLVVHIDPPNGGMYTVSILDCGVAADGNGDDTGTGQENEDDIGADQRNAEDTVIDKSISKKPLPNTGGYAILAPALGLLLISGVVAGLLVRRR
jgi:hypothetical protein